jgi:hypothetical protein
LFRLTTSGVRNEETLVILEKKFLKLSLGGFIVILLIVSNNTLGDGHTNCHDLVHGTTTRYANTDAEVLEAVSAKNEDRFINLKAHGFGFNEVKRFSIHTEDTVTSLYEGNSGGILLFTESSDLFKFVTHYLFL